MGKFINRSYIGYIFLIFFYSLISNSYGFQNKIVFKVNNEIITSIDILNEIEYRKLLNKNINKLPVERQLEIAKKSLIREKIRKIEISKFFVDTNIKDEQLEPVIKELIKKTKFESKDKLKKFLNSKNIKLDTFVEKIKIEILWNQLIINKFSKNLKIDKVKIKEDILKNNIQKNYLLSEIVFDLENESLDQKYSKIKKEINQNGFENAASTYSISDSSKDGGKLGWIKFNSLSENIKKEILKINKKDFTKPILIPGGFIILKIEDEKNAPIIKDIDTEIENISRTIANKQLNQFSNIYFNKIKKEFEIDEL